MARALRTLRVRQAVRYALRGKCSHLETYVLYGAGARTEARRRYYISVPGVQNVLFAAHGAQRIRRFTRSVAQSHLLMRAIVQRQRMP